MKLVRGAAAAGLLMLSLGAPGALGARADTIDTLVVTGTRQPERLATQAGNTALIPQAEIDLIGAHEPNEVLNRVPGVFINPGSGVEYLPAIRSPVLTGGAGAGSFLYLEDGVPITAAGFANINELFELNTELAGGIEVVRGPGSALYGSNAEHGLINVLTRGPTAEEGGFVDLTAGSFGREIARLFGSVGTPQAGATLGATIKHEDGYRASSGLNEQKVTIRADRDRGDVSTRVTLDGYNLDQQTAGYVVGEDAYKNTVLARGNLNPNAYRDAQGVRGALRTDRSGDSGVTSITIYGRWTTMNLLQHFLPSQALEFDGDWGAGFLADHEFEFADHSKAILGLDGEYADGFLKEIQTIPSFGQYPQGTHYDYNVRTGVIAPYVHVEWQAMARLLITAGARYEVARYAYSTHIPPGVNGLYLVAPDRTDVYQSFTPELGASYEIERNLFAFVRLARGARAPQVSDAYRLQNLQTVGAIKEETLDSVEAGLRGRAHGVSFEIDGYDMWKRHFFFRDADGYNVPDGKTRHRGVELEVEAPLPGRFELTGSWTYARHTYDFNRDVSSASEVIVSGNTVDSAPRWLGNMSLKWQPLRSLEAELDWSHVGMYYLDAANEHTYPGHDVFDLRTRWDVTPGIELHAAVRNLTNTDYAEHADYAFGQYRYFPGETRGFEGGVEVKF